MATTITLWALAAVALLLTLVLVPAMRRLALALGVVDEPDHRKIHDYPVPYLGGVAMYVAVTLGCTVAACIYPDLFEERVLAILGGATIIVLVGVVDDIVGLSAWSKLPFEVAAAAALFAAGIRIDVLDTPLGDLGAATVWVSFGLTAVWVVAITNAINLLDGLDGLAAGVVCIAAGANLVTALQADAAAAAFLYVLAIGVCLGFLRHNTHPASIFMGDAGSLLLGFLLATAALMAGSKRTMIFALLPVGLPLLDVLLAVLRRSRKGVHIFRADNEHLHHRLLRIGLSHRSVVAVYYVLSLYLALAAIVMFQLERTYALIMFVLYFMGLFMAWSILRFIETRISEQLDAAGPGRRDG